MSWVPLIALRHYGLKFNVEESSLLAVDGWAGLARLPEPRIGAAAMIDDNGVLHVVGGYTDGGATSSHICMSLQVGGSWSTCAPAPRAFAFPAYARLNGKLHVVGGVDSSGALTSHHMVYDPASDSWTLGEAPFQRAYAAAAAAGGGIVVCGGVDELGAVTGECWFYSGGSWRRTASITPRMALAAVSVGGRACFAGGSDGEEWLSVVECVDPVSNTVSRLPDLPYPGAPAAMVIAGSLSIIY